ncbi:hypothetical protein HZS_3356 [Henneguya salminicola]|nr:hypothetical protein HZS_3356 [Henneguya salminicola]
MIMIFVYIIWLKIIPILSRTTLNAHIKHNNLGSIFTALTMSVINPFIQIPVSVLEESDLAGPLVYFVLFGLCLLLAGKLNGFGAIYGITASSAFLMYSILNLMNIPLSFICVLSIIGYGLLPMWMV